MGTLLFGVISGPNIQTAEKMLEAARSDIDGVELRLDFFDAIDQAAIQAFLEKCKVPVMFTLRRKDQGGNFQGEEEERLKLLESLCALGPTYVDLEYDVPVAFRKRLFEKYPRIGFLSSYHDFSCMPSDLAEVYHKVKTPYAHIFKIAVTAFSSTDALKMMHFVRSTSAREKIIGICMGEEGDLTRILAPVIGCTLTYASLSSKDASAPGQLTASELQKTYRFRALNRATALYGLLGDPVNKSLGAVIHNAVFQDAHLNAVYVKIRVAKEEVAPFFEQALQLPFCGFSVTMPLKSAVMPLLAQMTEDTQKIGACNTIAIQDRQMSGYNTDGIGASNALERLGSVSGKQIVLIGAGGSAKAIAFEAKKRGAHLTILNRTPEKALELASMVGCRGGGWDLFEAVCEEGYDILINTIPESDRIDEKWILPEKIAMDIVYVPKNTPFLLMAANKKCKIVFGYEMFVAQALEQLKIWFPSGIDVDRAVGLIHIHGCVKE